MNTYSALQYKGACHDSQTGETSMHSMGRNEPILYKVVFKTFQKHIGSKNKYWVSKVIFYYAQVCEITYVSVVYFVCTFFHARAQRSQTCGLHAMRFGNFHTINIQVVLFTGVKLLGQQVNKFLFQTNIETARNDLPITHNTCYLSFRFSLQEMRYKSCFEIMPLLCQHHNAALWFLRMS